MKNMKTLWKLACHVIFWSWHGVYLAFLAFGLAPYVLWPVLKMTVAGEIPWSISATGFAISLLPLASLALGWRRLRQTPEGLFGLFYGAFAPAMVLLLMRLFMVRQLTDGAAHVLIGVGLGMCAWLAQLLWGLRDKPAGVEVLRMLGHAQLLVAGLYAAALLAFFALPMAGSFVLHGIPAIAEGLWEVFLDIPEVVAWFFRSIPGWVSDLFRFEWVEALLAIPLTALVAIPGFVLWVLLFCWSLTLFVMMPLALIVVFVGSWRQALAHFAGRLGRSLGLALTLGVVVANVAVFVHANQQHQQAAFEALKQKPRSDAERLALLEDAAQLREGLLNAYLAPWRYLGSTGSNGSVRDFWMNTFWMERDSAQGVQDAFNALAKPLVFEGSSLQKDSDEAAELWPQFFDSPLQEAEREAVLEAITTTWDADEVEAGLLNVGQRKVHLDRQEIELIEHGGYAEVVIHEVYRNQTPDQQEIFYLFNLPRSAAVTSLSLGATDDRSLAFDHVVAPRGAAQAVYIAERDKRVDPALLEQVGPRQYRLRAFPIPPVQSEGAEAPAFHLWLSYTALAQGDAWPMPALAEARNIYWDDDTERTINGERAPDSEEWTPPLIDASAPQPRMVLVVWVDD
jgi:putative PEP-CTERM system integral membrane protein